ncbi:Gfo/Idh/MocA family protein [Bacillus marinisedimentorum]|uniref:Gfo/Idh/MocA family protein n=1 Tax=Bacillus marinisedimentorum TaxID=1821260 RepID=UPI0007E01B78|nr:Gfo/Idh/MocA family oxidoreductase [Bacillus marinisedimentorum]
MQETVKWGILSTARIARTQLIPAIKNAQNAEVYGIASESGKAGEAAETLGIPHAYGSYTELLDDENINAVYIPLPNSLHAKWTIEAAKRSKHVLVEKPASVNVSEMEEMAAACREHDVIFMEAFMYQFHPQHMRVKEIVAAGEIGDIKLMRSTFSFQLDLTGKNIRLERGLGGGSLYDVGSYCIHASRNILGGEPASIYAAAAIHPDHGIDTSVSGVMTFGNVLAEFDCSFEQPQRDSYEVVGTKGTIEVPYAFRPDKNPDGGEGKLIIRNEAGERVETFAADQYVIQVEHFSDCVKTGRKPEYPAEAAIQNMKVIEACYTSIENAMPVKID